VPVPIGRLVALAFTGSAEPGLILECMLPGCGEQLLTEGCAVRISVWKRWDMGRWLHNWD